MPLIISGGGVTFTADDAEYDARRHDDELAVS
jgi:hypothetical protein